MKFDNLFLPLHGVEYKDIVQEVGSLKKHKEFTEYFLEDRRNEVVRYINYLYSAKSPLIKVYRDDLLSRKQESAVLAGFKEKDEWVVNNLYNLGNDAIIKMIIRFLTMQNNMKWNAICTMEQNFYQNSYYILKLDTDDVKQEKKHQLLQYNAEIIDKLEAMYDGLFLSNKDVMDKFQNKEEIKYYFTSPEEVANMPVFTRQQS